MNEHDILHYGIKGMQWGVRRKRSSKTGRVDSSDHTKAQGLKKRKLSEMSNEELRALNERLNLERNYKNLTAKPKIFDTTAGKAVQSLLMESAKELAKPYVKEKGEQAIAALIELQKKYKKP